MQIVCPTCQNKFEAVTRRAACQQCGTQLDVWAIASGHLSRATTSPPPQKRMDDSGKTGSAGPGSTGPDLPAAAASDTVLDLPLAEIVPGRSAESEPVLDASFSALPREFAQIAAPAAVTDQRLADESGAYLASVETLGNQSSRSGMGKLLLVLIPALLILSFAYYRSLRSSGEGKPVTASAPTMLPEPGPTSSIEESATPVQQASLAPSPTLEAKSHISPTATPTSDSRLSAVEAPGGENAIAQTRARAVNPPVANAKYTLQITAKPTEAEARQTAQKMIDAGLDAKIIKATVAAAGGAEAKTWYRVRVGAFATRDDATQYGEQLKHSGKIESYFVTDLR